MPLFDMSSHPSNSFASSATDEEARRLREMLQSPPPKTTSFYKHENSHGNFHSVPPAPQKLRRERADDIVECAMRLMDLAMDQNRVIKRLEKVIEENYVDNNN